MSTHSATLTPSAVGRARVLVVDDEYGPREAIAFTLGTEFAVDTAERAREALEITTDRNGCGTNWWARSYENISSFGDKPEPVGSHPVHVARAKRIHPQRERRECQSKPAEA